MFSKSNQMDCSRWWDGCTSNVIFLDAQCWPFIFQTLTVHSIRPSRTSGQNAVWASGGGPFCIVNFKKRLARKLRIIILLQFVLVFVRIHFSKTRKLSLLMIFAPSGRDHNSQNQFVRLWRH